MKEVANATFFIRGVNMRKIIDKIGKGLIVLITIAVIALMGLMLVYVVEQSQKAFNELGMTMFLPSTEWRPVSNHPKFGLLPAITGTLYVSLIAVILALIFGIGCAFFINFYLPDFLAKLSLSFIDLVAGIPSVIFGFIGLTLLVKKFAATFHMVASAMMAFGRGLGETMAVMMVIGNSAVFPKLFGRGQTIASLTALEMGSIEYGSLHLSALYVANFILLVILAIVLGIGTILKRRMVEDEIHH